MEYGININKYLNNTESDLTRQNSNRLGESETFN